MKEKMRDDEPDSSKQKSPREAGYEVDDEDSDAKSYPNWKKLKRYIMVSEEEDKSGEQEDDKDRDPDYNPFFDEDTLFWDPRRTHEEATQDPMKKEESVTSNSAEKLLEDEGYLIH